MIHPGASLFENSLLYWLLYLCSYYILRGIMWQITYSPCIFVPQCYVLDCDTLMLF